jgi:hypothetical protein
MMYECGLQAWHVGRPSREEYLMTELINGAGNPMGVVVQDFHSRGSKQRLVGTASDRQTVLDIGLRLAEIQGREFRQSRDACSERRQSGRPESVGEGQRAGKNEVGDRGRRRPKTGACLDGGEEALGPLVRIIEEHEPFVPGLAPLASPGMALAAWGAEARRFTVASLRLGQPSGQVLDTRGRVRERHQACPRRWDGGESL